MAHRSFHDFIASLIRPSCSHSLTFNLTPFMTSLTFNARYSYLYFPESKHIYPQSFALLVPFPKKLFLSFITYLNWISAFRSRSRVAFYRKPFFTSPSPWHPAHLELRASSLGNILCFHDSPYQSMLESPLSLSIPQKWNPLKLAIFWFWIHTALYIVPSSH